MKPPLQIPKVDFWIYGLSLVLCFLLFKQSDLNHTNSSSYAYLYGHFWDFYDYNKPRLGQNDYLPVFYWIFALWNIPLKLLGQIPEVTINTWMIATPIQTIWSKLLLVIFFFASVRLVGKITRLIYATDDPELKDAELRNEISSKYLLATSPIAIFAVFIFSQYDIFGVFFTLLGLHAYFEKKWRWFVFWFSIAISFKYFAAFIYLPLVLIIEKRFLSLVAYGVLGVFFTVVQFGLYWHSDIFRAEIFGLATSKASDGGLTLRFLLPALAYGGMCFYLYFSKLDLSLEASKWHRRVILSGVFTYALMFSWVRWHPQWLLLITPFICLSYPFIKQQKTLLTLEILGYLGLIVYCTNIWVGNVDITMVYGGVFGGLIPKTSYLASDIIGHKWMGLARTFIYLFLYSPLLVYGYELLVSSRAHRQFHLMGLSSSISEKSNALRKLLFKMRLLVGPYFFIGLTCVCLWLGFKVIQ